MVEERTPPVFQWMNERFRVYSFAEGGLPFVDFDPCFLLTKLSINFSSKAESVGNELKMVQKKDHAGTDI